MYDLLTIAAEVAVALAGFSGLFVAFSGRGRSMTVVERYALLFLLFSSLGASVLAMLPFVLMAWTDQAEFSNWYCIFSAAVVLGMAIWSWLAPVRRKALSETRRYTWVRPILMPIVWVVGLLQFVPFVFDVPAYGMYALALWWLIFIAAVQFIIQVAAATRSGDEPETG